MIFRTVKRNSDIELPEGQTWIVSQKVPINKKQLSLLTRFIKNIKIVQIDI